MEDSMHSLETFTYRTSPRNKREGIMPAESFGLGNTQQVLGMVDPAAMRYLASEARRYVPTVRAEIDELRLAIARKPREVARRAMLFGISTPNNDERDSLCFALAAYPRFGEVGPKALANTRYPSSVTGKIRRVGMYQDIEKGLRDIYRDYSEATPADLHPEALERVWHIGPKVARMITAVANPDAHVWTVDLWHARQVLWAAGLEYRVKASVTAAAYPALEAFWLDYRDEYFADQPCWVSQWSTWCAANGRFESHRSLWADLA
jgi:hypothetical protein